MYFKAVKLSENTVREIADWLQCGLECWIHKLKGTMYFLPKKDDPYFDPEQWREVLYALEGNESDYLVFQTMDSSQSYRMMQDFTWSLQESFERTELERALKSARPFHHFKLLVDVSDLNEKWSNHRFDAHMDWVKSQVNCFELVW
jgi:hypothetical protein